METSTSTPVPPAPVPSPAPAAPAVMPEVAVPVAAPVVVQQPVVPPKQGIFDGITLVDVGMIALVSLALFYSIYYHRIAIKKLGAQSSMQNDIDELKANVKKGLGTEYQTMT